jgi:P-type Cu2+ transporter
MAGLGLCSHCSLPLPARPIVAESEGEKLAFCCAGCRTVYRLVGRRGGESGWYLAKLGLAAILSGNVMMFQFLLYVDSYRELGAEIVRTTSWIMLGLSVAVYLLIGVPMLRSAWEAARQKRIGLDLLISLGSLVAIAASARETIRGTYRTYYDSGTMILVLVTLGAYLDAKSREKATLALRRTEERGRRLARVTREDQVSEVPPESVAAGEIVSVRAGEEIPTDGIVRTGVSDVEESGLSGEFLPRRVSPGDRIFAGSIALDGALTVESSGVAETLGERIRRLSEEARSRRAPIAIAADRACSIFVPVVLAISIGSLLIRGMLFHQWGTGGLSALAVLVVACPCALGLATPLATTVALSRLAAAGTLVRSGEALETLAKVRAAAFDKTGTLTEGKPHLEIAELSPEHFAASAAIEREVSHPFARAISADAETRGIAVPPARNVLVVAGGGAEGEVKGLRYAVGSFVWLQSRGVAVPVSGDEPGSVVWVTAGGEIVGSLRLSDPIRAEASAALAAIRAMGIRTMLLSGDRQKEVDRVAAEVGFDVGQGGLTPGEKAERLESERRIRRVAVAMVGDGVNDAVALSAADVGIAFGRAADLSRERAEVSVLREDLRDVAALFSLARRTLRTVRGNLLWAFGYNLVGVGLAAAGRLSPIVAATAMVLSSLFVVTNSMRLRTR